MNKKIFSKLFAVIIIIIVLSTSLFACAGLIEDIIVKIVEEITKDCYVIEDNILIAYSGEDLFPSPIIPANITEIADGAFAYNETITSIVIPEGVTYIGSDAFNNCTNLMSVTIPSSVTYIGARAFTNTDWLDFQTQGYVIEGDGILLDYIPTGVETSLNIPNTVKRIAPSIITNSSYNTITIPNTVIEIGADSFRGTSWLATQTDEFVIVGDGVLLSYNNISASTVEIPNTVKYISSSAFKNKGLLTSITIPASVTAIGEKAFFDCNSLTEFIVASENQSYSSLEGCLLSLDGTEFISYPIGKPEVTYSISNSITRIGAYAFSNINVESITIPDTVTDIGAGAFASCSNLASIIIPNSIIYIPYSSFAGCIALLT